MSGHEELITRRLSLRRPTEGDIDAVLAIHRDPAACRHNPSDALTTRAEAEERYGRWDALWQAHGFGYWTVRSRGASPVLGFCGVQPMELVGRPVLNLFYRFAPAAWGHGFAGEAATAVVSWSAAHVPELPLIARIRPENLPSQRVALRAGLRRAEHLDGPGYDGFDRIYVAEGSASLLA
ncbi:GNAT family N-acetyltransferase [Kitasatospora cathayae]|uniref:GNAT family N-acetyltransferase n=1 Tax=Kitasatospora cathayae TaxID=3004092 RepID=A0ABY7Q089_9ACTN|nr:GNAT family N-acetyltransferase [Kitasatospora sp. HUAS 3-15]WBP86036.1 GNAT family N-acetyltransferase [Kitasatospora sp. HUAS 3-15]